MATPVQLVTVNVFALLPPVSAAASMPTSQSVPRPTRPVSERVKLTSPDSTILSKPAPPSSVSLPTRPVIVSSPASPVIRLLRALPSSVLLPTEPSRSSMPVALESVSVKPAETVCDDVDDRSTDTPRPPNTAILEKSSVSVLALAASLMTRAPERSPVN